MVLALVEWRVAGEWRFAAVVSCSQRWRLLAARQVVALVFLFGRHQQKEASGPVVQAAQVHLYLHTER